MINVRKRSGKLEPFDIEKIKTALAETSDEAKQPLTESELNDIAREAARMLEGRREVPSRDIYVLLAGILYTRNMQVILRQYVGHERNGWRKA